METKFKDVAHLYLGCDRMWTRYSGGFETGIYGTDIFNSFLLREISLENGVAKPILSRLEDMAEEDKTKLCIKAQLISNNELPKSETHAAIMHETMKRYLMSAINDTPSENSGDDEPTRFSFQGWCELLPLFLPKYDLFNLIPSGEAIDRKTL